MKANGQCFHVVVLVFPHRGLKVNYFFRIEELTESLDEREKIKQVVKEREEKIETMNRSFDEKDKLLQEIESRFVIGFLIIMDLS